MNKTIGIYATDLFGEDSVKYLRRAYKDVKQKVALTDAELLTILRNGEVIQGIEPGRLFRMDMGRNSHVLGIATRFGPIALRVTAKRQIQVLMNRTLKPYSDDVMQSMVSVHNTRHIAMARYLGLEDDVSNTKFYNIGEWVEHKLATQ